MKRAGRFQMMNSMAFDEQSTMSHDAVHKPLYVSNASELDQFLLRVYTYYANGGFGSFALMQATYLARLLFSGALFLFLSAFVDYAALIAALWQQGDEHVALADYVRYVGLPWWCFPLCCALAVYTATVCCRCCVDLHHMLSVRDFYAFELKIDSHLLHSLRWDEVVERLVRSPELRRAGLGGDALDVVGRITRSANYFVAMVALDALAIPADEATCLTDTWNMLFTYATPTHYERSGDGSLESSDDASARLRTGRRRAADERPHPVLTRTLQWALERTLFALAFATPTRLRPELAALVQRRRPCRFDSPLDRRDATEVCCHADGEQRQRDEQQTDDNALTSSQEYMQDSLFEETHQPLLGAQQNEQKREEPVDARHKPQRYDDRTLGTLAASLSQRFRTLAVVGFFFAPLVLSFLLVHVVLEHGEQLRGQRNARDTLGTRTWSNEALYALRGYNEMPHLFRRRLARAYAPATRYAANFRSSSVTILARLFVYCTAALMFALLVFGVVHDDDALTRIDIALGRSGLWWLGVLGAGTAFVRSLLPDENAVFEPRRHLREVAEHTFHMPRLWIGREHTSGVRRDFFRHFTQRWSEVMREMLGVLFTPYLLWSVLPRRAEALLRFIVDNTIEEPRLGHICRFAALRVDLDGDPMYGGRYATQHSVPIDPDSVRWLEPRDVESQRDAIAVARAPQHGKLETSLVDFCAQYVSHRPHEATAYFIEQSVRRKTATGTRTGQPNTEAESSADQETSQPFSAIRRSHSSSFNEAIRDLLLAARHVPPS